MDDTSHLTDEEHEELQVKRVAFYLDHFRALPADAARTYAESLIRAIIGVAGDLDLDWPERLRLADVLNKRIGRYAYELHRNAIEAEKEQGHGEGQQRSNSGGRPDRCEPGITGA